MQVTTRHAPALEARPLTPRLWAVAGVLVGLAITFILDRLTGSAPVQHLYYLPILLAATSFGFLGGLSTAMTAILLYHLANPHLLTFRYEEADVVQIVLFVAVGIVAAKIRSDGRRLRALAMTDDLTGLHNLRSFEARLAKVLVDSRRTGAPCALLVLDVDRLKSLNDAHGHVAGATAVRTVGHVIHSQTARGSTACRYGGDEFAVVIPHCDQMRARRLADDLRAGVRSVALTLRGTTLPAGTLSISVGMAFASPGGASRDPISAGEALFAEADRALYVAKASGRDRVCTGRRVMYGPDRTVTPGRLRLLLGA